MREINLFELKAIYRDSMRIRGYCFGEGEKTLCVVGAMRGNEVQQLYCCSLLVQCLKELEGQGKLVKGKSVLVIPCANTYSMNTGKRFWPTDNSDINRMFPGYDKGETTQRIAAGLFNTIKDYEYGIQFASFYMPGRFTPHVRIMKTGYESIEDAKKFGLPYIVLRDPAPYDTTTLNYNWQIWETKAYSLYTQETARIDKKSAIKVIDSVMRFMERNGIISHLGKSGHVSDVIPESRLLVVATAQSGIFESCVEVENQVKEGDVLARIIHPYNGSVLEEVKATGEGIVFFRHSDPMVYSGTVAFKIIPRSAFKKSKNSRAN